jgi:hypothetical protein
MLALLTIALIARCAIAPEALLQRKGPRKRLLRGDGFGREVSDGPVARWLFAAPLTRVIVVHGLAKSTACS